MSPKSLFWEVFPSFPLPHTGNCYLSRSTPFCLLTTHLMPEKAELCWQLFVSSLSILLYSVTLSRELQAAEYLVLDNQNWESRKCGTPPFDMRQKVMTFGPSKRSSGSLFDGNSTFSIEGGTASFPFVKNWDNFLVKWYTYSSAILLSMCCLQVGRKLRKVFSRTYYVHSFE